MKIYKIKSLTTGLFSSGGQYPSFTKKGKTWAEKGHVTSHLSGQSTNGTRAYREQNCVVVCYDFEAGTETEFDIYQWRQEADIRRTTRETAKKQALAAEQLKHAKAAVALAERNLERLRQEARDKEE